MHSSLTGNLKYQSHLYSFKQNWDYTQWDVVTTGQDSNPGLMKLAGTDGATQPASKVAIADFVAQLGIASLASLPNSVGGAATPTPVPTAGQAINPSGDGVTTAGSVIVTTPPLPALVVTDQAKQRDNQRLLDIADLQKALENYKTKQGSYPSASTLQQTRSSQVLLDALVPTYITKLPIDPLADTYWYEYQSDGKGYTLRAVAEDKSNSRAIKGKAYYYFQLSGGTAQNS